MADLSLGSLCFLALMAFAAGIADAISGGGGLLTLPTYLLIGISPHMVTATSLTSSVPGCIVSAWRFFKGEKVHMQSAAIAGGISVIGAILGAKLNLLIPANIIQIIMLALIPIVAVVVLCKPNIGNGNTIDSIPPEKMVPIALAIGFFLGIYSGFIGAGCGTFLLLAFAYFLKLDLITASGNAKICGLFAVFAGMFTYALSGVVLWDLALFVSIFHMSGNYVGAGLALKKGAKIIRPMFIATLALLCIRMAYSAFA